MRYFGAPYTGSKNFLCEWIMAHIPRSPLFIDAFAGGCAVTHAAMLAGKADKYAANDISRHGVTLFRQAASFAPACWRRWVWRDEFARYRDDSPMTSLVWSFGSKGRDYWCAREVEAYYHALWLARANGDASAWDEFAPCSPASDDIRQHAAEVRRAWERYTGEPLTCAYPQELDPFARLNRLYAITEDGLNLDDLHTTVADYSTLPTDDPETIVYCDPPYHNSQRSYYYDGGKLVNFDFQRFNDWVKSIKALPIISEYSMPEEDYTCVASIDHLARLCATKNKKVVERLFVPTSRVDEYYSRLNKQQDK